jgi:membrane-associated phospholipid phosphatase
MLLAYLLIGFRADQLVLTAIFNLLYFISPTTRKLAIGFSIFIFYWIIFDFMKAFPNYRYQPVRIASLYELEKTIFGFGGAKGTITANEFFLTHHYTAVDLLSGFFYLCWIPVPLLFAGYLYLRNRKQFFFFALSFLTVNLIGFIIYYAYPAAPPWYIEQYGLRFNPNTAGNPAGLTRFDEFFHAPVFASIYSKSSNVFAAMPSLHASYPLLVLFYGLQFRLGKWNIFFLVLTVGIWFSAVYNSHHYLLDILAGIGVGLLGILLFQAFADRTNWGRKMIKWMVRVTSQP